MNISFSELVVVFLVALLLFGPEQLPQIARQLGKLGAEIRKGTQAVRREWYNAVYPPADEVRRDLAEHTRDLRSLRAEVLAPPAGSIATQSSRPAATTTKPAPEGADSPDTSQEVKP